MGVSAVCDCGIPWSYSLTISSNYVQILSLNAHAQLSSVKEVYLHLFLLVCIQTVKVHLKGRYHRPTNKTSKLYAGWEASIKAKYFLCLTTAEFFAKIYQVNLAAVHSKKVIMLVFSFMLAVAGMWRAVLDHCFVVCNNVPFLVLQSLLWNREYAGCFSTLCLC